MPEVNPKKEAMEWRRLWNLRRQHSSAFTIGALSKKIEVSAPFLSKIFSGQKAVPSRLREKLSEIFDLDAVERARLEWFAVLDALPANLQVDLQPVVERNIWLQYARAEKSDARSDSWSILSQWWNIAILELSSCVDFRSDISWIASTLAISEADVGDALRKLTLHGLLIVDSQGNFRKSDALLNFKASRSYEVVRNYHAQNMQRAILEMETNPEQNSFRRRRVSGVTLTVSRGRVEELLNRINLFLEEISAEFTQDIPEEVYQVGLQAIPLRMDGARKMEAQ